MLLQNHRPTSKDTFKPISRQSLQSPTKMLCCKYQLFSSFSIKQYNLGKSYCRNFNSIFLVSFTHELELRPRPTYTIRKIWRRKNKQWFYYRKWQDFKVLFCILINKILKTKEYFCSQSFFPLNFLLRFIEIWKLAQ